MVMRKSFLKIMISFAEKLPELSADLSPRARVKVFLIREVAAEKRRVNSLTYNKTSLRQMILVFVISSLFLILWREGIKT